MSNKNFKGQGCEEVWDSSRLPNVEINQDFVMIGGFSSGSAMSM